MKKQLIIIGTTLVLLTVVLSGCETTKDGNLSNGSQYETEVEGKIAFTSTSGSIHVINPDGTNEVRLTYGYKPIWSPNGKKISFVDDIYYSEAIYIMNSDGTNIIKIVNLSIEEYCWSPDSKKILYTPSGINGIYLLDIDSNDLIKIAENGSGCAFSPDGNKIIYYESYQAVNIMNSDGTNKKKLTDYFGEYQYSWSSDGERIISHTGEKRGDSYVMNSDGTNCIRVASGVYHPTWSPDGKKIAYTKYIGDDRYSLCIANPDGTGEVSIGVGEEKKVNFNLPYSWSPYGKRIVYSADEDIYIINIDGTDLTKLAAGFYPQWSSS